MLVLIAILVLLGLALVLVAFATFAARPPFRTRYAPTGPYDRVERGLGVKTWMPPITISRRRGD